MDQRKPNLSAVGRTWSNKAKYDYKKLRAEYIVGDWMTVASYLKDKGLPAYLADKKHLRGLTVEKKKLQEDIYMKSAEKTLQQDMEDLGKVRYRQARLARYLQLRGTEALKDPSIKINDPESARKILVSGLEQERKALGMEGTGNQNLTQINIGGGVKTNLDRVLESASYEQILELIAELKRRGRTRSISETSGISEEKAEDGEVV